MKHPRFVHITSADAYYWDDKTGTKKKHNTLFGLDADGQIWTRFYDGETYREWFPLSQSTTVTR